MVHNKRILPTLLLLVCGLFTSPTLASDNYFTDLIIGETGYLAGDADDNFYVSNDLISNSSMNSQWNTVVAYLEFYSGFDAEHDFYITGEDYGPVQAGYTDNFAWGTLHIANGNTVHLFDGNAAPGAALYVQSITGVDLDADNVTNIEGNSINIYYLSFLEDNAYLAETTYTLENGGFLIPITQCEGDFDGNGDVDEDDLSVFAADFGRTDCVAGDPCDGDFDIDDDVDGSDLAVFIDDFGRTGCPEAL